jgi:hypothetical protein
MVHQLLRRFALALCYPWCLLRNTSPYKVYERTWNSVFGRFPDICNCLYGKIY